MTYAETIKKICNEKKMSVTKMEKDLGFSNGYVGKLKDKIPTDKAIKIAKYLSLPSDYFLPEEIKKSPAQQNPLLEEIMIKASTMTDSEQKELLSFAGYIQSRH